MIDLNLTPNIDNPDEFYAALLEAHDGLGKDESDALNARLLLILANQIGDQSTLLHAIEAARVTAHDGAST